MTYEAEDDVETFIYDGFNEDKINMNRQPIDEEEFLKEFCLKDEDLEWKNLKEYCRDNKLTVEEIMKKLWII